MYIYNVAILDFFFAQVCPTMMNLNASDMIVMNISYFTFTVKMPLIFSTMVYNKSTS